MKRGIALGYALGLILTGAAVVWAQGGGCGQGNPNCVVPTPPVTDNSNRAANTSWVNLYFLSGIINAILNNLTVNGTLTANGAIIDASGNLTASSITVINALAASAISDSQLFVAGSVCNTSTGIFYTTSGGCVGQVQTLATGGTGATTQVGALSAICPGCQYSTPAITVNFNSAADTAFTVNSPTTNYSVNSAQIYNCSTSVTPVTFGLFTAPAGGGIALVASGTAVTVAAIGAAAVNNYQAVGTAGTTYLNASQIFFRITAPHTGTCSVSILLKPLT